MSFVLKATQQVHLGVLVLDKRKNPAAVQDPAWSSSDDGIVTVAPGPDGLSAVASAAGPTGSATVTWTADGDLGDGVRPLEGRIDIEVVAGDAAVVNISAGTPTELADAPADQPADQPPDAGVTPIGATPPDATGAGVGTEAGADTGAGGSTP
jgi:hypothetical protein